MKSSWGESTVKRFWLVVIVSADMSDVYKKKKLMYGPQEGQVAKVLLKKIVHKVTLIFNNLIDFVVLCHHGIMKYRFHPTGNENVLKDV